MTERRLCALVLKIWGLFWLAEALLSVPHMVLLFRSEPFSREQRFQVYSQWTSVIGTASTVIAAVILIAAAERIAAFVVADRDLTLPFAPVALEQLAFGLVGAYFLILSLRELAVTIYVLRTKPQWDSTGAYLWEHSAQSLVGAAVQGVLALVLLLGRRSLARLWLKLHPMSQATAEDSQDR